MSVTQKTRRNERGMDVNERMSGAPSDWRSDSVTTRRKRTRTRVDVRSPRSKISHNEVHRSRDDELIPTTTLGSSWTP